jgi:hypothetical protein
MLLSTAKHYDSQAMNPLRERDYKEDMLEIKGKLNSQDLFKQSNELRKIALERLDRFKSEFCESDYDPEEDSLVFVMGKD